METKHTKGEWQRHPVQRGLVVTIDEKNQIFNLPITTVELQDSILESEANAKLIAAAPDLLAALNQCVTLLSPSAIVMDVHKEMVRNDAIETIKKATE